MLPELSRVTKLIGVTWACNSHEVTLWYQHLTISKATAGTAHVFLKHCSLPHSLLAHRVYKYTCTIIHTKEAIKQILAWNPCVFHHILVWFGHFLYEEVTQKAVFVIQLLLGIHQVLHIWHAEVCLCTTGGISWAIPVCLSVGRTVVMVKGSLNWKKQGA